MRGQRKIKNPCRRCGLNPQLCICGLIPSLTLRTRVLLVIHARELQRTTNTGKLALEALPNSEVKVRGEDRQRLDLSPSLDPAYHSLLFYPCEDAAELTAAFVAKITQPILLIVPDGNWRQASKIQSRHPELAGIPHVMLKEPNLATRHLRAEHTSYGRSTLEAIAMALGVIEGPEVEAKLQTLYKAKLENTLKGRVPS